MKWDERKVDEAVLAVLYLTLHEEVRAWKIGFSEEGLRRAQEAARRLFS